MTDSEPTTIGEALRRLRHHLDVDVNLAVTAGAQLGSTWTLALMSDSGVLGPGGTVVPAGATTPASARHIVRHDPAAVRLRATALDIVVGWCVEVIGSRDLSRYGQPGLLGDDPNALAVTLAAETLLALAAGFEAPEVDDAAAAAAAP